MGVRIPVSLADILEVRSNGLNENEAWSVLGRGLKSLENLSENGEISVATCSGLTPESIFCRHDGSVEMKPSTSNTSDNPFLPPECSEDGKRQDLDTGKAIVYVFGSIINHALKIDSSGISSPELYSLLNMMTLTDPSVRLSLAKVIQVAQNQIQAKDIDSASVVQHMYSLIMGSNEDVSDVEVLHEKEPETTLIDVGVSPMPGIAFEKRTTLDVDKREIATSPMVAGNDRIQPTNNADVNFWVNHRKSSSDAEPATNSYSFDFGTPLAHSTELAEGTNSGTAIARRLEFDEASESTAESTDNIERQLSVDSTDNNDDRRFSVDVDRTSGWVGFSNSAMNDEDERFMQNTVTHSGLFDETSTLESEGKTKTATFMHDPFSDDDPKTFSGTNTEMPNFQLAFSSDPNSPERRNDLERSDVVGRNGRLSVLEELMPTDPLLFTKPKIHSAYDSVRSHHSDDCSFCSPRNERSKEINADRRSFSLERKYDMDLSSYRLTTKFDNNVNINLNDEQNLREAPKSALLNDDSIFASFENLSESTGGDFNSKSTPLCDSKDQLQSRLMSFDALEIDSHDQPRRDSSEMVDYEDQTTVPNRESDDEDDLPDDKTDIADQSELVTTIEQAPTPLPRNGRARKLSQSSTGMPDDSAQTSKVELYVRKHSSPTDRLAMPSHEKAVPVLGVQQALAMQKRQESAQIDNQLPSTSSPSPASPTETGTFLPKPLIRNPNFVRDSFSRSARRAPSQRRSTLLKSQQKSINGETMMNNNNNNNVRLGPEFLHKSRLPSIRLKAPSSKKKKLFRPACDTNVLVILLNGQRVDVACHVDSTADDVFQAVSTHTSLMERHFFGLTYLQDAEHFFLEPEQKLCKFAPPGWRNSSKDVVHAKVVYTLYLRLKYYPINLNFVKTEQTLHHIYLQLRRDIIDELLQCTRDASYQLAAIALQAEYGDRSPNDSASYFNVEHYFSHRQILDEQENESQRRTLMKELRSQYAGMSQKEAEVEFIRTCQQLREYGIHFHRVYATKPSQLLAPSPLGDPDTGTPLWIGIMPRGVIIFEERSGGARVPISQHPWHTTQTLQFDHKRFIILTQDTEQSKTKKLVYYTNDYRKSCYFVHFAASQHRFCMKMRFWATTLVADDSSKMGIGMAGMSNGNRQNTLQVPANGVGSLSNRSSETDSGISREASPEGREVYIGGELFQERPVDALMPQPRTPVTPITALKNGGAPGSSSKTPNTSLNRTLADISIPSRDVDGFNMTMKEPLSDSFKQRLDNAGVDENSVSSWDYETFTIKLYKDPRIGLGLTLVDGEIQGLKGVYVRTLTPGGPAELQGRLRVGDKIVAINGENLGKKTRYDAVNMVRLSEKDVEMEILRLKSLYSSDESLGSRSNGEHRENDTAGRHGTEHTSHRIMHTLPPDLLQPFSQNEMSFETNHGVEPDDLSMDIGKYLETEYKTGGVRFKGEKGAEFYTGLHDDESEKDDDERSSLASGTSVEASKSTKPAKKKQLDESDDEVEQNGDIRGTFGDGTFIKIDKQSSKSADDLASSMKSTESAGRAANIDWTNDLMCGSSMDSLDDERQGEMQFIGVELVKNEHGSLGIQVAGGKNTAKVYIKALVAEPALSCPDIMPGDQLASVNRLSTAGMSHADVVGLLKNATSPVLLGLIRPKSVSMLTNTNQHSTEKLAKETSNEALTLEVTLEKPPSGSLGLSLVKPRTGTGIYIRSINPESVAAKNGLLKEGDRLWEINEESVAESTPDEVVEKLKAAQGSVRLVVKRKENGDLEP